MKGLYRGFCRDGNGEGTIVLNGEEIKGIWVEGSLDHTEYYKYDGKIEDIYRISVMVIGIDENDFPCYQSGYDYEVIPETICEAVRGAKDKNGKQIYEGDILSTPFEYEAFYSEQIRSYYELGEVYYDKGCVGWYVRFSNEGNYPLFEYNDSEVVVIGTIFDKEKNDGNDC